MSAAGTAEDDNPSKFVLDGSVGINTLNNNAIVLLGQKSKVDGSEVKLSADATTQAEGSYGAKEENGKVLFLHKVLDGPTDKSYGINVAKLANLPNLFI